MTDGKTEAWRGIKPYKPEKATMKSVKITFINDDEPKIFNDVISHSLTDTHVRITYSNGDIGIFNINEIKSIEFTTTLPKQILHG